MAGEEIDMEENEFIEDNPEVTPEEIEEVALDVESVHGSSDETVTYIDIGTASISVNDLSGETSEPVEVTEPPFDFNFIAYVGSGGIDSGVFAAMCWNLALLYFAFDIIKWLDVKFEKIFRRMGKDG